MSQAIPENNPDTKAPLVASLQEIVGEEYVMFDEMTHAYAIDGIVPQAVVFPASESEVSEVLSYARSAGLKVFPRGGGTQMGLGNVPVEVDIVLSVERLNRVIAHEPADMTVTVEAGLRLCDLQSTLAQSGQFLPVDPPLADETTIGGILAARAFGPLRFGFRPISDFLLGIKVVTAEGKVAKAGGRVVKNVTGYELGRLYTGSMGTLAVIVEATFKVQPLPRHRSVLLLGFDEFVAARQYVQTIIESGVQPAFIEWAGPTHRQPGLARLLSSDRQASSILAVGFMGTEEEVEWQIEKVQEALSSTQSPPFFVEPHSWDTLYGAMMDVHRGPDSSGMTCRVHMRDTRLYDYVAELIGEPPGAGQGITFVAHAGSGVARIHWPDAGELPEGDETALTTVTSWRTRAESLGGRLIIESAPLWMKNQIDVWGTPGNDFFLHQAVKDKMDPNRLLSPGRFVGGI